MKPPNKICSFCEIPYRVKPYLIPTSKFCSLSCKANSERTEIKALCLICKSPFTHISSRCNKAKYCSTSCYRVAQKNKGKIEYICQHCLKPFIGHACHTSESLCSRRISAIVSPKFVRMTRLKLGRDTSCVRHALTPSEFMPVPPTNDFTA